MNKLIKRALNAPFNKTNLTIIAVIIIVLLGLLFVLVNHMVPPHKKLW